MPVLGVHFRQAFLVPIGVMLLGTRTLNLSNALVDGLSKVLRWCAYRWGLCIRETSATMDVAVLLLDKASGLIS